MERAQMNATRSGLLLGLLAVASPAAAETSAAAMRAFGLIGTWSVDCATDMTQPCVDIDRCFPRLTFTVPLRGNPVREVLSPTAEAGKVFRGAAEIESAALIADDKIRITTTDSVRPVGPDTPTSRTSDETWETVYRKSGDTLRVWSAQRTDGTKIGVRDGFRYEQDGDWKPADGPAKQWHRTDEQTATLQKCRD
jgi:hypothetical protein